MRKTQTSALDSLLVSQHGRVNVKADLRGYFEYAATSSSHLLGCSSHDGDETTRAARGGDAPQVCHAAVVNFFGCTAKPAGGSEQRRVTFYWRRKGAEVRQQRRERENRIVVTRTGASFNRNSSGRLLRMAMGSI
jgi:hypothetical protein